MVKRSRFLHTLTRNALRAAALLALAAAPLWAKSRVDFVAQFWALSECQAERCRTQLWLVDRWRSQNSGQALSLDLAGVTGQQWQPSQAITVPASGWASAVVDYQWDGQRPAQLSLGAAQSWPVQAVAAPSRECEAGQIGDTQSQLQPPNGLRLPGRLDLALDAKASGSVVRFRPASSGCGGETIEMRLWLNASEPYCVSRLRGASGQVYIPPTPTDPVLELRQGQRSFWLSLPLADIGD